MKKTKIFHFPFKIPLVLLFFVLLTSCGETPKQTLQFVVRPPALQKNTGDLATTAVSGALPISISVRVEDLNGNILVRDTLSVGSPGSNVKILPVGRIKIITGFLAQGLTNGRTASNYCSNHNGGNGVNENVDVGHDDDTILYSETTIIHDISSVTFTDTVDLVYPTFTQFSFNRFGFKFVDSQGVVPGATVQYVDPISNAFISDPCDGTPFFDVASNIGTLSINLPVWRADKTFSFIATDPRLGVSKSFTGTFTDASTTISFQKFDFVDGSITPMSNSETYLSDTTISSRLNAGKNPRFPDFDLSSSSYYESMISPYYSIESPAYSNVDFASVLDEDAAFSQSLPRDPIRNRRLILKCREKVLSSMSLSTAPYSSCERNNIAGSLGFALTKRVEMYFVDEDGYAPFSDCYGTENSSSISCSHSLPFVLYVSPVLPAM